MTLSWSRKRATVWARSKDMLSWQVCQTECFRRLGGVPAVLRIDSEADQAGRPVDGPPAERNRRSRRVRAAGAW
jgi:hypothetical protein